MSLDTRDMKYSLSRSPTIFFTSVEEEAMAVGFGFRDRGGQV